MQIIGLSIRTTNENQQSAQDIPALWGKFITEGTAEKIPDKVDDSIYCVYTDYEKDFTKPYTVILGCRVNSIESLPDGMTYTVIEKENYSKYVASSPEEVFNEWVKIWNSDLKRTYKADFEVYAADSSIEIFVGID